MLSSLTGSETVAEVLLYRRRENEDTTITKVHTTGFSKPVRGDLVLMVKQHILLSYLEKLNHYKIKATIRLQIDLRLYNGAFGIEIRNLVPTCKGFP